MWKMSRARRIFLFIVFLFSTIFLSGCWDMKTFEETGFILQLGLELDDNGELLYSMTMPVVEEEIQQKVEILYTTADLLREGRDKLRNTSGKRIEGGKTQQIHFSRELAEKGLGEILDVYMRSSENPLLANITVVEGSPLEMYQMSLEYEDKTRVAFYVTDLIDDARNRTSTSDTRVYDYMIMHKSRTIDPTAVHISYDKEGIEITGTALFNGDKMVGTLDSVQSGLLHAMMGKRINFSYFYRETDQHTSQTGKSGIALGLKKAKRKIRFDMSGDIPKISMDLKITSSLSEYDTMHQLDDPKSKKQIEEKVARSIKKDCEDILAYLQEIGADPIGFAEIARSKYNSFYKSVEWKKIYPDIEFIVDVKLSIVSQGAIN